MEREIIREPLQVTSVFNSFLTSADKTGLTLVPLPPPGQSGLVSSMFLFYCMLPKHEVCKAICDLKAKNLLIELHVNMASEKIPKVYRGSTYTIEQSFLPIRHFSKFSQFCKSYSFKNKLIHSN